MKYFIKLKIYFIFLSGFHVFEDINLRKPIDKRKIVCTYMSVLCLLCYGVFMAILLSSCFVKMLSLQFVWVFLIVFTFYFFLLLFWFKDWLFIL